MGEDDIVELLWKSGQVVEISQTQRHTSDIPSIPPLILRGSGSGGGGIEENAPPPLPPPLLHHHQQPSHQSLFIHEDEMVSWLHHPHREGDFYSELAAATQPPSSVSLAPLPPSASYELPNTQITATRRVENFMNFFTGGRLEAAGPWVPPVVRQSTQVGSSATPSSSATESCLTPASQSTESRATTAIVGGVSHTFVVPGLGWKEKEKAVAIATEIAGTSSSGVSKAEAKPIQIQPATETATADERKRKEREETAGEIKETKEAGPSTSRKRSRAAEMHNLSERRRREKINAKMKALQETIPRCNKSDKASMLEDAVDYVKSLQMIIQVIMTGGGSMMPMMYTPNMQRFMPDMVMEIMGMNRPPFIPFPGTAHMAGPGPSDPAPSHPLPNIQALDPSRAHLQGQQPDPAPNQPQFPGYLNPYSQFVGLQQMQQQPPPPPPLQNQTTAQMTFSQPSSSKEPEDQENKPTG